MLRMLPLALALYFPWEDLFVEVMFMAAVWVPLMLLETFIEYRVKLRVMDREHQLARDLMYESRILEDMDEEDDEDS